MTFKGSLLCRDEKIRTSDLQHPMLARYLATLHPVDLFDLKNEQR